MGALTTAQTYSLTTDEVAALTTTQISQGLTTTQIEVLSTTQIMALTSTQVGAFTTVQISHLTMFSSPLVLDLSGNGITTQSVSAGTQFDLNATGQAVNTGWVSGSGEGLLVYDPTNGPITSGSQLFGTATILPNGQKAANGFAALAALDTNGDGAITSADAGWSNLKVWVDANSNGTTQTGELHTLDSLGIVQLNLSYTSDPSMNNGNLVGMISSFVTSNGQTHEMADVWFQTSQIQSTNAVVAPTAVSAAQVLATTQAVLSTSQVAALTTGGQVSALATAQIAGLTATQVAALTPPQASALTTATGLQSQVGGLVQAMGSFSQSQSSVASSSGVPLINTQPDASAATVVGVSVNVAGMVGALQQFGSNGNPVVTSPIVGSVTTSTTLTSSPLPNQVNNGILATGK